MKKNSRLSVFKNICLVVLATTAIFFIGCSKKIHFAQSTVVPAAEGTIKLKKDANNNYKIDISVIRLAEPSRLQPPKKTYVVWMVTENNGTKNLGQLTSSSGWLSKTLKASLSTITPFEPLRFFITAEDNGSSSYAGNQVVLTSEQFKN